MKKLFVWLGLTTLIVAAAFLFYRNKQTAPQDWNAVPSDQRVSYQVSYDLRQKPQGDEERELFHIQGDFAQVKQDDATIQSQWTDIARFRMLGSPVTPDLVQAMLRQPIVSARLDPNLEIQHAIGKDFPGRFLGLQLSILDKAFITETRYKSESVQRKEQDEFGTYTVDYLFSKSGDHLKVQRSWRPSSDGRVMFADGANSLTYVFDGNGLLLTVDGQLDFFYQANGRSDSYSAEFHMKRSGQEAMLLPKVAWNSLPRADLARAEVEAHRADAPNPEDLRTPVENMKEALQRLDTFNRQSPGEDQQEIFMAVKFSLMENPGGVSEVVEKILTYKGGDPEAESRSALLFGAMAATGQSDVADALATLAQTQCNDDFCRMQAITSLNTHSKPDSENTRVMLDIARAVPDDELAGAAYMAAGSIASKVNEADNATAKALLSDLTAAPTEDRRLAIIKAMGNHGSPEYLPALEKELKSEDVFMKSSAAYSLRALPNVNDLLLQNLQKDGSDIVNMDVLKALNQRRMDQNETSAIAETLAASTDSDIHKVLVDVLANAYRMNPKATEPAIALLESKAASEDLKVFLHDQIEEVKTDLESTETE